MTSADRKRELKQRTAEYKPQMGVVSFTWQPATPTFDGFGQRTLLC